MDIKPRYGENRIGATIFEPLKATHEDWLDVKSMIYGGGGYNQRKSWFMNGIDSRMLVGKLLAHETYSKFIWIEDKINFVFKIMMSYPPNSKRELILIGSESAVYVIHQKRTPNNILENVKRWLMKNLAGLKPVACKFEFGTNKKLWGVLIDDKDIIHLTLEKPSYGEVNKYVYNEWVWTE